MGFGKQGTGEILHERATLTIGGLAAAAAIKSTAGLLDNLLDDFRIIKTEYLISQVGNWGAVGDEIYFGICNGELTVAEIAANIVSNGPQNRNDRGRQESSMRAVWVLGQLKGSSTTIVEDVLDGGKVQEKTLRWTFSNPEGWSWFAFNPLTGALTTGAVFSITAKHFGVWVS